MDARHTVITVLVALKDQIGERDTDAVLHTLCDDEECMECATICCPEGDFLHFHHDGCPSCDMPPEEEKTDSCGSCGAEYTYGDGHECDELPG